MTTPRMGLGDFLGPVPQQPKPPRTPDREFRPFSGREWALVVLSVIVVFLLLDIAIATERSARVNCGEYESANNINICALVP